MTLFVQVHLGGDQKYQIVVQWPNEKTPSTVSNGRLRTVHWLLLKMINAVVQVIVVNHLSFVQIKFKENAT